MKSDAREKSFDVMKWLRATRAELYEETKHMSPEVKAGVALPETDASRTSQVVRPQKGAGRRATWPGASAFSGTCGMTSTYGEKSFDVMKWLRETRDRIYEETKEMSFEEKRRWMEERIRRDPHLSMLYDRRRAPEGGRRGPVRPHSQGPAE